MYICDMANKKIKYIDDKIYRKNIDLSGATIKELDSLAKEDLREWKPFVEKKLKEIADSAKRKKNK